MTFEVIERLKKEYTDKFVIVDPTTPELKRFVGLTGTVKTVNMNGRALVEFDNPVDISWYDIDPAYLTVVEQKLKKAAPVEKHAEAAEKKPTAAKPAGKSPLELARAQGAAGAAKAPAASSAGEKPLSKLEQARLQGAGGAKPAAAAATGDKPLSKLEQARLQGATKGGSAAAPKAEPAAVSSPATPASGKPLSKLELARQQGAQKAGGAASSPPPAAAEAEPVAAEPAAVAPPVPVVEAPKPASGGKPLSKIELARQQGAFKGNQ